MSGTRDISRLLRPKSIAVIGGGFFAPNVVKQCIKMGFAGHIWPVHPTKSEIEGVATFATVDALPGAPDATFIGVNRHLTIDIVRSLAERGAGGAICFASGFLEAGADDADGARLQQELVKAAGDMPVIGPNCYGLINYADGALLWPDQHGGRRLAPGERGVAIITQSSNIACNFTMQTRGLPVAFLMTAGNQAQTGLSEMALGLIEDERVSALGLHIEGFDSVAGFERLAARARELKKPIVAMKVGRSEQARTATVSHTASLAGSDAASDAFLKRLGIARVDAIPSFLETLKLLHVVGPLSGPKLSSMSCSGGEASVMADSAEGRRVGFPKLEAAHHARVRSTLGPLVTIANPLDYHTFIWNDVPAMTKAFSAMASGGFDLNMLVLDFPRSDRCSDADWWGAVTAFEAALSANGARGAIVASMGENLAEAYAEGLVAKGIVPLHGIVEAFDAAEAASFIGEAWAKADRAPASPLWNGRIEGSNGGTDQPTLPARPTEAAAKAMLAGLGLPVPKGIEAGSTDEAVAAAHELGFPVAVKALGLAHKSEAGAVRLHLRDEAAVREAAHGLIGLGSGLYVERMIANSVAELIVGVTRDPVFGPVMTLGSGGVLVELLRDSATLLLPASRADIEATLRGLKLFPLLDGYRGRPKADLAATIDAVAGISRFVLAHADRIEELDINPLIACAEGEGAWIADALLIFTENAHD
ncbi:MAG: acetate--CoA ligase family protein [Alphaproteobacteria bacterium]|nr:acetate--CoA ligase family protein [Alphaproteobacteria bacterium]MBU0804460.1 acetate--CoA ligase family protein [Alphaproteobacteria bacterium]MBU0872172.1 acetate--CoA ligase family protein [Alphaproteobacteria bacterium]MBU1403264.1 acetate--CoA ligase family protein [Alphaproteobacteria bacterium]MBU1593048.1 acetate--CoA ligase family protein [Alphaproteobacteria bacterium]